ncbi:MAG: cupin domain-containing protein [Negativicutes bacterium]
MIKRGTELKSEVFSKRFGGQGEIKIMKLLDDAQLQGKGRLFARNTLPPGASLGLHEHKGDIEAYYILSGEGMVDDNGTKVLVTAGDVMYTGNGESHSIENIGAVDLEFIALILYV